MPADPPIPVNDISAVILAGGKARRMGGEDKGLIELNGRPLIGYIISALRPQTGDIIINANRNQPRYRTFGYPVVEDMLGDYFGPLVGMATGMQASTRPYLLTVPCDSPLVPDHLTATLYHAMLGENAELGVAHDGERMQPVFALLKCELLPSLLDYLGEGGRKIDTWYARHRVALADFSASPEMFLNLNTPQDKAELEGSVPG
ncbi:MAG: molybdenum cofactor guanylyltransferase MobA [Gammaproteobacteria bacterium]